jgi:NADH-quinone oxidoreductase subunit C
MTDKSTALKAAGALKAVGDHVAASLPGAVLDAAMAFGELTLRIARERIVEVVTFLRDDPQCRYITIVDVAGVDYPERAERLEVVYHLMSPTRNDRVRLKVTTDETTPVPSITHVFPGANWFEREAYDMVGVLFSGHPDLRRLLTDYGFEGHPLRRDFPMTGYVEVRYDDQEKRVKYEPVRLTQEYRQFDFLSPWEGVDYPLPGDEKAKAK